MDIEKILEIDYDNFQFIKLKAKIAHKSLLEGSWPI
jgi:hypothetical protein